MARPPQILQWLIWYCCGTYLSFCHRTASEANDLMIRAFFIAVSILRAWRNPHIFRSFLWYSNVPVNFFKFRSTEFAACLKPPSRNNHRKSAFTRATFSCENRRLAFFLSQSILFLSFLIWDKRKGKMPILEAKSRPRNCSLQRLIQGLNNMTSWTKIMQSASS